ncbi:MAG: hypothetical protein A3B22_01855 [Candidatus Zambryskibacteria bacterium RIFCSPLOWO2_01_FULL_47_33]|nr:MAG: hypothetical protein A3B22_01855 [Candidatus Zambryskibacteria bacterium RIFCSPLOWO2_01_FULL_47_33]
MDIKIITSGYSCGHKHLVACIDNIPCPLCHRVMKLYNPGFTETGWRCKSCGQFLRIGANKIQRGFWVKLPEPFMLLDECVKLRTEREEGRLRIHALNLALRRGIKYSVAEEKALRRRKETNTLNALPLP